MPAYNQVSSSDKELSMQCRKREEGFMPLISTLPCLHKIKEVPLTERKESLHASNVDSSMPPILTLLYLRATKKVPLTEKREESFYTSNIDSGMPPISTLLCLHTTRKVPLTENYARTLGRGRRVSIPPRSIVAYLRCPLCYACVRLSKFLSLRIIYAIPKEAGELPCL
ncbi:hypothetical protein EV426DRAFT_709703 [Tirmania nivea]|nr:hypothetical protein EV426DRAFT_709703 [Tirmania nivea]